MATLIHLNGSSGVGKSTLARRYVDDHPGVLDLDADLVVSLIGGWQADFFAALKLARHLALAMAEAHLRTGHDVVMPQLVTSFDEADQSEAAASAAQSDYIELALLADPEEQVQRFRSKAAQSPVDRQVANDIDAQGGDALLHKINWDLLAYLAHRPEAVRLDTHGDGSDASYARLSAALLDSRHSR